MSDVVPGWLEARALSSPARPAYWRRGSDARWSSTNWAEVHRRVCTLASNLASRGLQKGDRVVIMAPTCPEWEYCHLAVLAAGGVIVGMDAHDAPDNIRHILQTVQPRVLILASGEHATTLCAMLPQRPLLVLTLEAQGTEEVTGLHELFVTERATEHASLPLPDPEDAATVIFTSGSTGQPRGVAYTHGQLALAADAILGRFSGVGEDDRLACWLPLSNLFQRIINICAIRSGSQCYFVDTPMDIVQRLPEIRPALFIGVPRFYEKLYAGLQGELAKRPLFVRRLVDWAWGQGERVRRREREGRNPTLPQRVLHGVANALVLKRLRAPMGSDLKFMVSGSAPMPTWLLERLHGLGWLVLEAYGTSECIVPIAINTPDAYRFGSVGRPLPSNEIKLAEDGELLVRGPGVFAGYYGEARDDASPDAQGYLHTGDLARVDEDGFLWLTGRKSEVFKTSTGRRIAPVPVEATLKRLAYVEHAVVMGRNRPVPVAVLSVDGGAFPGAADHPLSEEQLQQMRQDIMRTTESLPIAQRPAGALVTRRRLGIASGELTANLKLRRHHIETHYAAELDTLYTALAAADRGACLVREVT